MHTNKYIQIYNLFTSTKFGKKLGSSIRYERYKPAHITNMQWEDLLGDDVNNLRHMLVILNIINQLQTNIPIEPEKMHLLKIAAVTHDWGESIIGDITYEKKTESLENQEAKALETIVNEIVEDKNMKEEILQTLSEIIFNPTTETGEIFNSIERIGYLNTAILSFEKSIQFEKSDPKLFLSLQWLTNNTIIRQLDFMMKKSQKHQFLKDYLNNQRETIDQIFAEIDSRSFDLYETGEQIEEARSTFEIVKKTWASTFK